MLHLYKVMMDKLNKTCIFTVKLQSKEYKLGFPCFFKKLGLIFLILLVLFLLFKRALCNH